MTEETESLAGTQTRAVIQDLDAIYESIETAQSAWKAASPFSCPEGCGSCCVDFEPDLLESEALYLAAWMIYHQEEKADAILNGSFISPRTRSTAGVKGSGCFLFDPDSPYHCTVYGGRALICRLFGHSGDRGKDGRKRWKPCRFLPTGTKDAGHQFEEDELLERFGHSPPVMSDFTSGAQSLMPDRIQERLPLSEALRDAIAKIRMLQRFVIYLPATQ